MILDCHMHLYSGFLGTPDGHAATSLSYGRILLDGRVIQQIPPSFEHTVSTPEVALGYMDYHGVGKALLTQGPFYGFHNDYVAQAVRHYPDRFYGLACYNPTLEDRGADDLERWMRQEGLVGIKCEMPWTRRLWPDFDLLGEPAMRVWRRCADLNGLLMLHTLPGTLICEQLPHLLEALPTLRVLLCHLGNVPNPGWTEQVRLAKHANVYMDIAGIWGAGNDEEYPFPTAQQALAWAVQEVGADKLLWGTDYPSALRDGTYTEYINLVMRHTPLSQEQRAFIIGENAQRLLSSVGVR